MKKSVVLVLLLCVVSLFLLGCTVANSSTSSTNQNTSSTNVSTVAPVVEKNLSSDNTFVPPSLPPQEDLNPPITSDNVVSQELSPQQLCVNSCLSAKSKGINLGSGPCLGLVVQDWVCDVAHSPRLAIDDLVANTCPDFAQGRANHFVEVDESCEVIQIY
ncbi:MAG: hypothetical protein WCW13_04370 [archaeon]|jgi:hypothetical protein